MKRTFQPSNRKKQARIPWKMATMVVGIGARHAKAKETAVSDEYNGVKA